MEFTKPILFEEAIEKLGKRSVVGSALRSDQWSSLPTAIREGSFFSATIEDVRFLQEGKDLLGAFLRNSREKVVGPDGKTRLALKAGGRAQFIENVREFAMERGLGPLDPADEGTIKDITSEQRLALIFDTQTKAANDYGYWKQGQDPDILDEFPAQRFIRVAEVKSPRERHVQFEGAVRLKIDLEFWLSMNDPAFGGFGVPWGPWGFNSGMDVEDVDRAEAEALGLLEPGEKVEPVERELTDTLAAGVRSLDPEMVDWIQEKLDGRVQISDGVAKWTKPRK
ncbi:MAG: hypothetical protein KIT22_10100 [Verrucomicrobiae bacterium]|nr:hypothetical protein [Verrucomicrobiae bacterium]